MKKLVLVTNDLPGSGKSTLVEVLSAKLAKEGFHTGLLATNCSDDADERLSESPAMTHWDFEEDADMNILIGKLDECDALVIDVGTGDLPELHDFAERSDLFDCLGELGVELTLAIPLHGDSDPTDTVVEIAESFSDNADYVVILDGSRSRKDWDGSYAQKVMNYLGAIEVTAPIANGSLEKALDEHEFELHRAQASRDDLPRNLKTALSKWEGKFGDKIKSSACDFFFPQERTEEPAPVSSSYRGKPNQAIV